jgi:hypothetical protein
VLRPVQLDGQFECGHAGASRRLCSESKPARD